jgi:dTMP kinase
MFWIAFEGLDGCGKSTQARLLAEALGAELTHEPGSTPLGVRLRHELLHTEEEVSPRAEMLLYAADRAQHVHQFVRPLLDVGECVVTDRSVWSSVAYQGFGRGLGAPLVQRVNDAALEGLWPHAVVLIDVPRRTLRARLDRELDRIESAPESFHNSVADGFQVLATQHQWLVVDGTASVQEVQRSVVDGLSRQLGAPFTRMLRRDGGAHDNR